MGNSVTNGYQRVWTGYAFESDELKPLNRNVFTNDSWAETNPCAYLAVVVCFAMLIYTIVMIAVGVRSQALPSVEGDSTSLPSEFSAHRAFPHVVAIAQDIGARPTASVNLNRTFEHVVNYVESLRVSGAPTISIELQKATGAFVSDSIAYSYVNIHNLIVRVGNPAATKYILLSARLETSFVSPGATSDAAGVAVLLETMRAYCSDSQLNEATTALMFAFLGAPDGRGAHALVTRYGDSTLTCSNSISAYVNVDGFGIGGLSAVVGVSNLWMAKSLASSVVHHRAPQPLRDVTESGLDASDSDYRLYNVLLPSLPGVDFAWYSGGYLHRTLRDDMVHTTMGSLQHMGDNVKAVSDYLLANIGSATLEAGRPMLYDYMQAGCVVMSSNAHIALGSIFAAVGIFAGIVEALATGVKSEGSTAAKFCVQMAYLALGTSGVIVSLGASLTLSIFLGGFYSWASPLSWYRSLWLALAMFTPAALLGTVFVQWGVSAIFEALGRQAPSGMRRRALADEYAWLKASRFTQAGVFVTLAIALVITLIVLPSASVAILWWLIWGVLGWVFSASVAALHGAFGERNPTNDYWWLCLIISIIPPGLLSSDWAVATLSVLVPSMGRLGAGVDSPWVQTFAMRLFSIPVRPDVLIGMVVAAFVSVGITPIMPLLHRTRNVARVVLIALVVLGCAFFLAFIPAYTVDTPHRIHMTHIASYNGSQIATAEVVASLDEHSIHSILEFAAGENFTTQWECPTRTHCRTIVAPPAPNIDEPLISLLSNIYDPTTQLRTMEVQILNEGEYFTGIAVDGPLKSWSLTPTLPPVIPNWSGYVVNNLAGEEGSRNLRFSIVAYGQSAVSMKVRTHNYHLSPELRSLWARMPAESVLDPHGNYVCAETTVVL